MSANTVGGVDTLNSAGQFTQFGGNIIAQNGQSGIDLLGNDSGVTGGTANLGNAIAGNLIGTSADGSRAVPNAGDGILMSGTTDNTIGGTNVLNSDGSLSSFSGNLISGNAGTGLLLSASNQNLAEGNWIGTNLAGTGSVPNAVLGVLIFSGASGNSIGAANIDGSAANLVSGNAQAGIEIQGAGTSGNVVQGNRVGLAASGTATIPNLSDGIVVSAASNIIGGTATGAGNVISGNLGSGVRITDSLPSFGTTSADDNQLLGNVIGLSPAGTSAGLGNVQNGVEIDNAAGTTIGGATATAGTGAGNVISGNRQSGIALSGSTTGSLILGNLVGLDASGAATQGNFIAGIVLSGVSGNTIGGAIPGAGNVLSNNGTAGLQIDAGANNLAEGNRIGTDRSATAAAGNLQNGVDINHSSGNTIGGTTGLAGNIISGNNLSGIYISGAGATGNAVLGNLIGTDRSGTLAVPDGQDGVVVDSALSNTIGGIIPGAGNVISGNRSHGVELRGTTSTPAQLNVVEGNLLGTAVNGLTALGNAQDGVFLSAGTSGNRVGGTVSGAGNVISGNLANGVELVPARPVTLWPATSSASI